MPSPLFICSCTIFIPLFRRLDAIIVMYALSKLFYVKNGDRYEKCQKKKKKIKQKERENITKMNDFSLSVYTIHMCFCGLLIQHTTSLISFRFSCSSNAHHLRFDLMHIQIPASFDHVEYAILTRLSAKIVL